MDGIEAARLIRGRLPGVKILMLSLHREPDRVRQAMSAGVVGFVSKDVALDELVRIISAAHAGEKISSPFLLNLKLAREEGIETYGLSEREMKSLRLLTEGKSNAEIADLLCVSEQTVKKELGAVFERLGVKNRTQAAVKGVRMGLLDNIDGETTP